MHEIQSAVFQCFLLFSRPGLEYAYLASKMIQNITPYVIRFVRWGDTIAYGLQQHSCIGTQKCDFNM